MPFADPFLRFSRAFNCRCLSFADIALYVDHRKKLVEAERDSKSKLEAFKRDFDERLKQERLTHQMGLRTARDDAEKEAQEKMMKKIQELKKVKICLTISK